VRWPSLQRDALLSFAAEGIYRPTWSSAILEELESRLEPRLHSGSSALTTTACKGSVGHDRDRVCVIRSFLVEK
jgi:hypothetical protein